MHIWILAFVATVVLVVLKLIGVLALLSWWIVFLPLIVAAGFAILGALLIGIFAGKAFGTFVRDLNDQPQFTRR